MKVGTFRLNKDQRKGPPSRATLIGVKYNLYVQSCYIVHTTYICNTLTPQIKGKCGATNFMANQQSPKSGDSLHKTGNGSTPDPFFLAHISKEKSGLAMQDY